MQKGKKTLAQTLADQAMGKDVSITKAVKESQAMKTRRERTQLYGTTYASPSDPRPNVPSSQRRTKENSQVAFGKKFQVGKEVNKIKGNTFT